MGMQGKEADTSHGLSWEKSLYVPNYRDREKFTLKNNNKDCLDSIKLLNYSCEFLLFSLF